MPSSAATRAPSSPASRTQSAIVTPETGTKGQTSVAPMRLWAPLWARMSMTSAALAMARNAASRTASGGPMKVTTVRFVEAPGSTSRSFTPATASISAVMARIFSLSRPSLKFGTHSTSFMA